MTDEKFEKFIDSLAEGEEFEESEESDSDSEEEYESEDRQKMHMLEMMGVSTYELQKVTTFKVVKPNK